MQQKLTEEQKLIIIFRVEPGCLGPKGLEHVSGFCEFAQKNIQSMDADFIIWRILPRDNKDMPEMEYMLGNKRLNTGHAEKYLQMFDHHLEEFEGHLHEKLAELIDQYLGH